MVVAIVGIIAGLALINLRAFSNVLVRSQLNKLHMTCVYLSHAAQAAQEELTLTLHTDTNSYDYQGHREYLPAGISFGAPSHVYGPPGNPVHSVQKPSSFDEDIIHFYKDGTMQAGSIYLTDGKKHTYALTCAVGSLSCLRMYRYDQSWQLIVE